MSVVESGECQPFHVGGSCFYPALNTNTNSPPSSSDRHSQEMWSFVTITTSRYTYIYYYTGYHVFSSEYPQTGGPSEVSQITQPGWCDNTDTAPEDFHNESKQAKRKKKILNQKSEC